MILDSLQAAWFALCLWRRKLALIAKLEETFQTRCSFHSSIIHFPHPDRRHVKSWGNFKLSKKFLFEARLGERKAAGQFERLLKCTNSENPQSGSLPAPSMHKQNFSEASTFALIALTIPTTIMKKVDLTNMVDNTNTVNNTKWLRQGFQHQH